MPSIIRATTTSGLQVAPDNSGSLELQTNGTTTAITIDTAQRAAFVAGTAALPAITTTGDTNTGMFFPAADTIAFAEGGTEAMRLDSSGNVLINSAQSGSKLNIESSSSANTVVASPSIILQNRNSTSGTFLLGGIFGNAFRDTSNVQNCAGVWMEAQNGSAGALAKQGAVVFGTIDVAGLSSGVQWNIPTERMRIDSSGNLFLGQTAYTVPPTQTVDFFSGGLIINPTRRTTGSAANCFWNAADGVFSRSTSSLKYKTDVQDAIHGLSDVLKLRPITYKGKSESDEGKIFGGFLAEEVDEIGLKEFVEYDIDNKPDSLAYGNMVSLLTKAIQEQQNIINDLKARVETLEAK
jgi:hypothetical protein